MVIIYFSAPTTAQWVIPVNPPWWQSHCELHKMNPYEKSAQIKITCDVLRTTTIFGLMSCIVSQNDATFGARSHKFTLTSIWDEPCSGSESEIYGWSSLHLFGNDLSSNSSYFHWREKELRAIHSCTVDRKKRCWQSRRNDNQGWFLMIKLYNAFCIWCINIQHKSTI